MTKTIKVEPVNDTYLDYTGPWLGGADTELVYKFTCQKTANYRMLMRMHQPLRPGEAGDQRNDVFVRLEGDYTSATSKPKSELQKNHKFWGRGVNNWGSCHKLEIGTHIDAIYGLKKGEEYTFVMSGRSGGTCIDYILFVNNDLVGEVNNNDDIAVIFPDYMRPGLGLVDPTSMVIPKDTVKVRKGTSSSISIDWQPDNAKKDVTWSSSNSASISVNEDGMVTAKGDVGELAIIKAESTVTDLKDSCVVEIIEWYAVPIESIEVSPAYDTISETGKVQLTANLFPVDTDDKAILWSSSDDTKATVDENGLVQAKSSGKVTIRATSQVNNQIFGEAQIVMAEMINPFFELVNKNQYKTNNYYIGDTMKVAINYHAGTFQTVKKAIMVKFRQIRPGWQVEKDWFSKDLSSYIGTTQGTINVDIPLKDLIPTAQLPQDHFYFLFTKAEFTNGVEIQSSINPINILPKATGAEDFYLGKDDLESTIYPNPANNFLIIEKPNTVESMNVFIWNAAGELLHNEKIVENKKRINTSSYKKGLYLVQYQVDNKTISKKIIIQ